MLSAFIFNKILKYKCKLILSNSSNTIIFEEVIDSTILPLA